MLVALVDVEWRVSNVLLHLVCCCCWHAVCSQELYGCCVSDLFPCKWPLYCVQQVALYILYWYSWSGRFAQRVGEGLLAVCVCVGCVCCLPLYVLVVYLCVHCLKDSGSRYLCLHSGLLAGLSPRRGNVIQFYFIFSIDIPHVCFLSLLFYSLWLWKIIKK